MGENVNFFFLELSVILTSHVASTEMLFSGQSVMVDDICKLIS